MDILTKIKSPLTFLTGKSGSGKSSVLAALVKLASTNNTTEKIRIFSPDHRFRKQVFGEEVLFEQFSVSNLSPMAESEVIRRYSVVETSVNQLLAIKSGTKYIFLDDCEVLFNNPKYSFKLGYLIQDITQDRDDLKFIISSRSIDSAPTIFGNQFIGNIHNHLILKNDYGGHFYLKYGINANLINPGEIVPLVGEQILPIIKFDFGELAKFHKIEKPKKKIFATVLDILGGARVNEKI